MMDAYLFVHFQEKKTPDGEQARFAVSKDGYHWEALNGGQPVLWSYKGEKGGRDFAIVRNRFNGKFYILGTDLSLSYEMNGRYGGSWEAISRKGSKSLILWESEDLVRWSEQKLLSLGDETFGCLWAPDVIYDPVEENYIVHWSSSRSFDDFSSKAIYASRTRDFEHFTRPFLLFELEGSTIIDSAIYEEHGWYYLFVKNEDRATRIRLYKSESPTGPYVPVEAFDKSMDKLEEGMYEGPAAVQLADGSWNLFLDYYGKNRKGIGYVAFHGESLAAGNFECCEENCFFPYLFKHGTILKIAEEEYDRLKSWNWEKEEKEKQEKTCS